MSLTYTKHIVINSMHINVLFNLWRAVLYPLGYLPLLGSSLRYELLKFWEIKYTTVDVIVNTHHYFGYPKCLILNIVSVNWTIYFPSWKYMFTLRKRNQVVLPCLYQR